MTNKKDKLFTAKVEENLFSAFKQTLKYPFHSIKSPRLSGMQHSEISGLW